MRAGTYRRTNRRTPTGRPTTLAISRMPTGAGAAAATAIAAASPEPAPGMASPPGSFASTSAPPIAAASPTTAPPGEPTEDPGTGLPIVPIALLGLAVGVGLGFLLRRRSTTG